MKILLLFLLVVTNCGEFWDYTFNTTLNCTLVSQIDAQLMWDTLRLHSLDKYAFLILSPIILVLLALVIATYAIKQSRSIPGDIILALTICEILVIGTSFIEAIYETANSSPIHPPQFLSFCNAVAVFALLGWLGLNYYNMIFCLVLAHSVRNTLKGSSIKSIVYHGVGVCLVSVLTIVVYITNGVGKSINCICAIKFSDVAPFVVLSAPLALILIAGVSIYRFKKGIPKNSFFEHQSVYNYYFIYILLVIILQITISILGLVGDLNCRSNSPDPALSAAFSFENIATLIHPFIIMFIRYHHPAVKSTIKKIILPIFKRKDSHEDLFERAISGTEIQMEDFNWLGSLLQSIRGSQVFSFLTGMLISHVQFKNDPVRNVKDIDFTSHYVFHLNQFSADDYLEKRTNQRQSKRVRIELGGIKPLDYEVTSFCPRVFKHTLNSMNINLQNSLSILLNSQNIKAVAQIDGGKSGQFFFCSHDFNILFKTISQAEAEVYLNNARWFNEHFDSQEYSLISKIIGLYRFKRTDIIDSNVYIILQKNLAMCNRIHINRIFDLKGSKYNRETLAEKKVTDLSTVTLKDLDFLNTEHKIHISTISSKNIKRILGSDIKFLKSLGVMDYSLLVMKVNWDQVAFFKKKHIDQVIEFGQNPFEIVPSELQPGIYYHFTIIDYLQTWNKIKHAQNWFKKLMAREFKESIITAEEPLTYAHRLDKFLEKIF